MRGRPGAIGAVLAMTLAGCAGAPPAPSGPMPPALVGEALDARLAERDGWIARTEAWAFSGRAAISRAGKGGSGRIEWAQRDRRNYEISLSAPVTRQSWRLSGDLHSAAGRIEGLAGGPREGGSAEDLLLETTGLRVPLQQIGSWMLGSIAPGAPVRDVRYDVQGRPVELHQAGWTVRYLEWRPGPAGAPDLPARIDAESGDARVKLIIEDWTFAQP